MSKSSLPQTRVLVVVGTRPEAIKMALLCKALESHPEFEYALCVTGQQRFMVDQVLTLFSLKPHFDLDLMRTDQSLADVTTGALLKMAPVLNDFRPEWVLVQGDTTSAMAGALAAFYARANIGHVEAGLRTGNKYSPWPEEVNRKLIAGLADVHFAPSVTARDNLVGEGIPPERIHLTGNTGVDALVHMSRSLDSDRSLLNALDQEFSFLDRSRRLILVTAHRRENFGEPVQNICRALIDIVQNFPDTELLWPIHLNPQVHAPVRAMLSAAPAECRSRIHLVGPAEYLAFVYLLKRAHLVLTDSGGVQEEAPLLGRPVLVVRDDTERPEPVEAGTSRVVGTRPERIFEEVERLLEDEVHYRSMSRVSNPYGDGRASARIVELLRKVRPNRLARRGAGLGE
jgi:UDP-N-acetylglucosamine 2-epimerase (non-hydrolysing)